MLKFVFKGEPRAVQSFRYTREGRRYQPQEIVDWKNYIKLTAQQQLPPDHKLFYGPVGVSVRFSFAPLKSFNKVQKRTLASGDPLYKITKPDLTDNLMKGLIDALSGIVWERDQQICKVDSEKIYGLIPQTELWVRSLDPQTDKIFNLF